MSLINIGYDASGNGNNWTANNLDYDTTSTGTDVMVDVPTNWGTDTGVGGEVRGNYATLNPLKQVGTLANGNLDITTTATSGITMYGFSTIGVNSGKWYFETTAGTVSTATYVGLYSDPNLATTNYAEYALNNGLWFTTVGGSGSFSASASQGDILGVAVDIDNGTFQLFKNGTSLGTITGITLNTRTWFLGVVSTHAVSTPYSLNFGQRPFAYTAPSGFKALCTQNLPDPTIADGGNYFNAVLYTGNGSTQSITGVGFQPDFTWIKSRSAVDNHNLFNAVVGLPNRLFSNLTNAENTTAGTLTSFNSDGFSVGSISDVNSNGVTFVGWNWKANGAGSSNTAGTITSTVSASQTAGFSIVTYTGNATSGATVGHGLGAAPSMVIVKSRSSGSTGWYVYHTSVGNTKALLLNSTIAADTFTGYWNNTTPSSTVFTLGDGVDTNASGGNFVAYCFAPVESYSAFGSFQGNGSSDGPFIFCNFRPRYVLVKNASTTGDWFVYDTSRNTYNVADSRLKPNLSDAEGTGGSYGPDILSNGFKMRSNFGELNGSGNTIIYACFAENPFKYALAR